MELAIEKLGKKPQFKWLRIELLQVDGRYQREIKQDGVTLINRIVRDFKWARFGALLVAGPDRIGDYAVIDGQHRLEAARRHPQISEVPCLVVDAGDVPSQARTFKGVNKDRRGVTRINVFWADVAAGEESAVRVRAVCEECGCFVSRAGTGRQKPLHTVAVSAIEQCLALDEGALRAALTTLVEAQGEAENAFRSATIKALTRMYALLPDLDRKRLVRILAEMDLDDEIERARTFRDTMGGAVETALQAILTRAYNRNLRMGQIPEPVR